MVQMGSNAWSRGVSAEHRQVRSEITLVLALYVVVVACTLTLLALPRAVAPAHLPALTFHRLDASRLLRRDKAVAAKTPPSAEAQSLVSLYEKQGLAEAGVLEVKDVREAASKRRAEIKRAMADLIRRHGQGGLIALQAQALKRLKAALDGKGTAQERQAVLGSFPSMLERYGLVQNGKLLAPYSVIRTLFKARWNFIHGLPPVDAFGRQERQAYYGWLLLHAPEVPLQRRLEAAVHYKAANGPRANEALGVLLYQTGQYARAFQAFSLAYARTSDIRLRNHAFAAQQAEALLSRGIR